MDFHARRQIGKFLFELMSSREFRRPPVQPARVGWGGAGAVRVDRRGVRRCAWRPTRQPDRSAPSAPGRHRESALRRFRRGQQAGDRTRGEDGVGYGSGGEPMGRRAFDRGGHALEPHAEVGKVRALAEPLIEQSSQPIVGVEVRPVAGQRAELSKDRSAEHSPVGEAGPQIDHAGDGSRRRVGRDEGTVEGPDTRSDDQVRDDLPFQERAAACPPRRLRECHRHPGRMRLSAREPPYEDGTPRPMKG